MSTIGLQASPDEIRGYCRKWRIRELALFGSVLRDDFGPESDVDVLVAFEAEASWSLWDLAQAQEELGALMGRPVDLVERRAVEASENWIRRREILSTARTIYGG